MKKFYVIPKIFTWDAICINLNGKQINLKDALKDTSACGFMLVYESLEELKKDFPGEEYIVVESTLPQGVD